MLEDGATGAILQELEEDWRRGDSGDDMDASDAANERGDMGMAEKADVWPLPP
jgi:hypothetical protein